MKGFSLKWLQENVFDQLSQSAIDESPILGAFQSHVKTAHETATSLAVGALTPQEVIQIFGLVESHHTDVWSLAKHDLFQPPPALEAIQQEIEFVTQGAPRAETYAHCLLNNILVCCVAEEKSLASKALEESTNFISELDHPTTPLLQPEFAQLSLRLETEICHQIAYKGEKRLLTGIADYTLWYDDQSKYGTNLLVVEAKRPGAIYDAENQVLGYMGAVHEIRRMEGRRNAVVYGITTDGDMFRFWCVDNDSVVTSSHAYEWSRGQKDAITSFMRYIVRAAIASSPTTTRLKDSTKREVGLLVFRDAHSKESFDYGVGESLEGYPADFSDEMEIVDPPNLHTHSEHS